MKQLRSGNNRRLRRSQRGSALLIVFVFAAIIAIMLYREMPVAVFEAQRQKEELLIDRGNQYKRAVKLFVRKFQIFPASIDALENTNRIRFLRHKFEDPFTGKADWRLIHAGPGGILIDSKVGTDTKNQPGGPHAPDSSTQTSAGLGQGLVQGFGQGLGQGFGGSGTSSANTAPADVVIPAIPQRAPAIMAGTERTELNSVPLQAPVEPNNGQDIDASASIQIIQPEGSDPNTNLQNSPDNQPAPNRKRLNAINPESGNASVPYPGYPGPPMALPSGQNANASSNTAGGGGNNTLTGNPAAGDSQAQALLNQLNTQNPRGQQQQGQTGNGQITVGGGIAGVASKASGHSIKVLNDMVDISLWEFCYDLRKETSAGAGTLGQAPAGVLNNPAQPQNGNTAGGTQAAPLVK